MLCPKCNNNHKKNDGTYCKCGYWFVFRPDVDSGMTDNKFLSLVKKASADGRYYFTFSQLYLISSTMETNEVGIFVFYPMAFLVCSAFPQPILFLSILVAIGIIHLIIHLNRSPPNQEELRTLVKKWSYAKGFPDKMLVKPSLHEPPPQFPEGDLYDYGVERIIIVEHRLLVDLLVKNGFHTDQRALIFSVDDYPSYIAERAKILLKASSDLPIYLLHDATEKGGAMKQKINYPEHKVIDLGIFPEQIKNLSALKPLRLKHQQYHTYLDVLPYATLSAIGGAAIAAGVPFDEVLESRKENDDYG